MQLKLNRKEIFACVVVTIVAALLSSVFYTVLTFVGILPMLNKFSFWPAIVIYTITFLALIGLPVLVLIMMLALLISLYKVNSKEVVMLIGILIGIIITGAGIIYDPVPLREGLALTIMNVLTGIICGWVYWQIALKK